MNRTVWVKSVAPVATGCCGDSQLFSPLLCGVSGLQSVFVWDCVYGEKNSNDLERRQDGDEDQQVQINWGTEKDGHPSLCMHKYSL